MTKEFYDALARWRSAHDHAFGLMPRNGTISSTEEMTAWSEARDSERDLRAELDRIAAKFQDQPIVANPRTQSARSPTLTGSSGPLRGHLFSAQGS